MSTKPEEASSPRPGSGRDDLLLLAILSVLAGLVDVIGFLRLGHVFTAHITGNLVVMADEVANGGPPHVAQLLSIPVFIVAVAFAYALVLQARTSRGRLPLLVGQALLLLLVLYFAVRANAVGVPSRTQTILAAMLAVAAMAFQNAFIRLTLRESLTTSVMTGNVATSVIAFVALFWPGPWTHEEAVGKLRRTVPLVLGFFGGCALGAAAATHLGPWAWSAPALLSLAAIPMGIRFPVPLTPQLGR